MHPQLADLLQVKIDGVKAPIRAGATGEALRHVRGAVEVDVVQHDGDPIPAQHHILLDKVGAHGMRQGFCRQRVFRQVTAGAAVGDNNGADGRITRG